MAKALELTWVTKLRQWRKRRFVKGKRKDFYLGTGTGKDDRQSYALALAKWKIKEAELDAANATTKFQEMNRPWAEMLAARKIEPSEHDRTPPMRTEPYSRGDEVHPSMKRYLEEKPIPPKPKEKLLNQYIDEYVAEQRARYEHGTKFPDAPQHERISGQRFIAYRETAKIMQKNWSGELLPKDEAGLESLMQRYRTEQKGLMTAGTIKPASFNERIKTMRHFLGFLYRKRHIAIIPRETERLCSKYKIKSSARALDVKTIQLLFREASPRLKTYIALGLNCGFYAVDIANLMHCHIKGDYIACDRHKTGVPTRFKLWPVTKALLAQNCNSNGELALVAKNGGPLLFVDPDKERDRGVRWCQIENDLFALRKRLKLTAISFSNFRDTSSTFIDGVDRGLTDLFDGHKDNRMARFYIDASKIDYGRMFSRLDSVLGELEMFYALDASSDRPARPALD